MADLIFSETGGLTVLKLITYFSTLYSYWVKLGNVHVVERRKPMLDLPVKPYLYQPRMNYVMVNATKSLGTNPLL